MRIVAFHSIKKLLETARREFVSICRTSGSGTLLEMCQSFVD